MFSSYLSAKKRIPTGGNGESGESCGQPLAGVRRPSPFSFERLYGACPKDEKYKEGAGALSAEATLVLFSAFAERLDWGRAEYVKRSELSWPAATQRRQFNYTRTKLTTR